MTGQTIFCGFFLLGILLTFPSVQTSSIAIAYQPEDLRAIVSDIITSELAALNCSTSPSPNDLALKLQEIKRAVDEIKESLMLSSVVLENEMGGTADECRTLRKSLIENHSNTPRLSLSESSIRDILSALSSDIDVIKSKLENSSYEFPATTATPATTSERYYEATEQYTTEKSTSASIEKYSSTRATSPEPNVPTEGYTTDESTTGTDTYPPLSTTTTDLPDTARNVSFTYFDALVSRQLSPQKGSTFNGSTINDIMSQVSRVGDSGKGIVVVFINHLDRTINNFKMYDPKPSALHPAPSSIAPHTKEVFTFAEPSCCSVLTAFSFDISGGHAGIASFMDFYSPELFGVAFVPTRTSMENYFNTQTGFPGSSQSVKMRLTQKLAVAHQNLYAKMSVNEIGNGITTVVIEIVEETDASNSWDEFLGTSAKPTTTSEEDVATEHYTTTEESIYTTGRTEIMEEFEGATTEQLDTVAVDLDAYYTEGDESEGYNENFTTPMPVIVVSKSEGPTNYSLTFHEPSTAEEGIKNGTKTDDQDVQEFPLTPTVTSSSPPSFSSTTNYEINSKIDCKMDLVVLLDGSVSISGNDFKMAKEFVVKFFAEISNQGKNRLGLVLYSDEPRIIIPLDWDKSEEMNQTIQKIEQPNGQTFTNDGMRTALEVFRNSARQGVNKKALVIITDGESTDGVTEIQNVLEEEITPFVIGIGYHVNSSELLTLAGGEISRVKRLINYDELLEVIKPHDSDICHDPIAAAGGIPNTI